VRLLLDENLSPLQAQVLRAGGHDVTSVLEVGLSGADDPTVRAFAIETGRVLVTLDGDFGNVLRYPPGSTPGIIRLRIHPATEQAIEALLGWAVSRLSNVDLRGETGCGRQEQNQGSRLRSGVFSARSDIKLCQYVGLQQPVISVDTKKKELVGEFKNNGPDGRPRGEPEKVRGHDFLIPELGRAAPYGIYDLAQNTGWVSVGVDHDTASFAVETIRRWWHAMGQPKYPQAKRLLITADGGGSNGSRLRLWKLELQTLADETGLAIAVSHFPPGTSKWNKIEHRLFSFISKNWRGQPLTSLKVIVSLIAATTTKKGLKVHAEIDDRKYPTGIKVPDEDMARINLRRDEFHGEWNYEILPRQ
jgi:predicted nuclease of predicted toxin-antitoxin system